MISAVLFDLDGTLLDIDIEPFLRSYFGLLGPVIADLLGNGATAAEGLAAVIAGTEAMSGVHPGQTNREVFEAKFAEMTGVDLSGTEAADRIENFYREAFPALKGSHVPHQGAARAVEVARMLGLRTALATNPIFPLAAIAERAAWTGIGHEGFDLVTSYETSTATKPHGTYFVEIAERLGVDASECLMVGDDPLLDLGAAEVGMKTFYVGSAPASSYDFRGDLDELAGLLPTLV